MGAKDPRIDDYIAQANDFARPILEHIRKLVHTACPDVRETMKWRFPTFDYKGMLCDMAAFKKHCTFGFWKGTIMNDPHNTLTQTGETAMGHMGKLTSVSDLPDDAIIIDLVKEAMRLNDEGVKVPKRAATQAQELDIPEYFIKAVEGNAEALKTFEGFSYSNKKEYVEWVTGAKTETTRQKRLTTSVEWLSEGKVRNWKYLKNK